MNSEDENYADQQHVFESYGPWMIENAFKGYNCSLFAYGQTGSGKTHTMMGYDNDVGFIPRLCQGIFETIHLLNKTGAEQSYHVEAAYFEIYNERVFDLLGSNQKSSGLRVREHPKTGAYVEDLLTLAVNSYEEIEKLLHEGSNSRRVAETKMNKESSRSHAVFQLLIRNTRVQSDGKRFEKTSKLYLVDLAGSERVNASGVTGARLKEAANINKSLSALADVIKALTCPKASDEKSFVPYRNSVLTWLLKESLGGNAKTVMLATLSPDAVNYQETLSTLKYAERAKKIVNNARVNKESNAMLIESLQMEIQMLQEQLMSQETGSSTGRELEIGRLKARLESEEKLVVKLSESWEQKRMQAESHFANLKHENSLLQAQKTAMEAQMQQLQLEKQLLEEREAEEERKRNERHSRHKLQVEHQLQRRRSDLSKQHDLQKQLDGAIMQVDELSLLLESAENTKQELKETLELERRKNEEQRIKSERAILKERQHILKQTNKLSKICGQYFPSDQFEAKEGERVDAFKALEFFLKENTIQMETIVENLTMILDENITTGTDVLMSSLKVLVDETEFLRLHNLRLSELKTPILGFLNQPGADLKMIPELLKKQLEATNSDHAYRKEIDALKVEYRCQEKQQSDTMTSLKEQLRELANSHQVQILNQEKLTAELVYVQQGLKTKTMELQALLQVQEQGEVHQEQQVLNLNQKNYQLEQEFAIERAKLVAELASHQSSLNDKADELDSLMKTQSLQTDLDQQVLILNLKNHQLEQDFAIEREKFAAELENLQCSLDRKTNELASFIQTQNEGETDREQRILILKQTNYQLEQDFTIERAKLVAELTSLQSSLNGKADELDSLIKIQNEGDANQEKQILILKQTNCQLEQDFAIDRAKLVVELANLQSSLSSKTDELNSLMKIQNERDANHEQRCSDFEAVIAVATNNDESKSRKLEELETQIYELKENREDRQNIIEYETLMLVQEKEIQESAVKLDNLQRDLDLRTRELSTTKKSIQALEIAVESHLQTEESLQKQLGSVESLLSEEKRVHAESLNRLELSSQASLTVLQKQLHDCEGEIQRMQFLVHDAQDKLSKAELENQVNFQKAQESESKRVQSELEFQKQMFEINSRLETTASHSQLIAAENELQIKNLETKYLEAEKSSGLEIENLKRELKEDQQRCSNYSRDTDTLNLKISGLTIQLTESQSKQSSLEAISSLETGSRVAILEEDLTKLTQELTKFTGQLSTARKDLIRTEEQLQVQQNKTHALNAKLNDLGIKYFDSLRSSKEECIRHKKEMGELHDECERFQGILKTERFTFDKIFAAQAEVLNYSQFEERPKTAS